jgi:putative ABC transport system ATP-binding protein
MSNVVKIYHTEYVETHALRNFSLEVKSGEFVAVMGPSGSGKTTFLNVAGLLETFDSGTYEIDGRDVGRLSDDARSDLRNKLIGFVFQGFNLLPDLDIYDNIDVPLRYRGMKRMERRERINEVLARVGLGGRARHMPSQLSGGQQQRAAIARALVGEPAFLLADEPTGNLDSGMAGQVMDLLEQIHALGTTIVLVTHDAEISRRADRTVHVVDGELSQVPSQTSSAPPARAALA